MGGIVIPPALPYSGFIPAIAMHHTPPFKLDARQVDSSLAVHHKLPTPTAWMQLSACLSRVLTVANRPRAEAHPASASGCNRCVAAAQAKNVDFCVASCGSLLFSVPGQ